MNAPAVGLGISRLGQISITAHDLPRATAFYKDILGLPLLFSDGHSAFFDCAGVRLMLAKPEQSELDHPSSIVYFVVPNIAAASERLRASNVRLEGEPHLIARMPDHDLWMVHFYDSEGNLHALMSEVKKSGEVDRLRQPCAPQSRTE
jgi:methylmalonyl-CoA/ethylmalonyl-CoA epimerase